MRKLLKDIKSARWAIMIIIAYFVFFRKIIYTICPVVLITGYPCPGCGMTRAGLRLLRLDFAGAWEMHPFIYAVAILGTLFFINRYLLDDKYLSFLKIIIVFTASAMIIFYIWRMYNMFPEIPPMTYYEWNCIERILSVLTSLRIA